MILGIVNLHIIFKGTKGYIQHRSQPQAASHGEKWMLLLYMYATFSSPKKNFVFDLGIHDWA